MQAKFSYFLALNNLIPTKDHSISRYLLSPKNETVLGREVNCQIVVDLDQYPTGSRRHAEVCFTEKKQILCRICDLNAANGTYLNGQRLQGCQTASTPVQDLVENVPQINQVRTYANQPRTKVLS